GGRTTAREEAALRLHHAEHRVRGGDADVDAAQHLHATGHARAVDRGDDRIVDLHVAEDRPRAVLEAAAVDLLHLPPADLRREHARFVASYDARDRPRAVFAAVAVALLLFALAVLLRELGDLRDVGLEVGAGLDLAGHTGDDRQPDVFVVAEVATRLRQVAE